MNAKRRKTLVTVAGLVCQARNLLQEIAEEERESVDNMPDAFKEAPHGDRREEIAQMLEESVTSLEEVENTLEECAE